MAQSVPAIVLSMDANLAVAEEAHPTASLFTHTAGLGRGRVAHEDDVNDNTSAGLGSGESHVPPRDVSVLVVDNGALVKNRQVCRSCVRVLCAIVSLILTFLLAVDVYLACRDFYEYGMQPDPYHDGHRDVLLWLVLFVPALLECGAMIAFLLCQLLSCDFCPALTFFGVDAGGTRNSSGTRACEGICVELKGRRTLCKCAVLLVFSAFTAILYLYVFTDPAYMLRHLVFHVICVWVAHLRTFFFSIFAFAIM